MDLLSKFNEWRSSDKQKPEEGAISMCPEERLARLEKSAQDKDMLDQKQSELIAGLAENIAELSNANQTLLTQTKVLIWLVIPSLVLAATALVASLV